MTQVYPGRIATVIPVDGEVSFLICRKYGKERLIEESKFTWSQGFGTLYFWVSYSASLEVVTLRILYCYLNIQNPTLKVGTRYEGRWKRWTKRLDPGAGRPE